MRDTGGSDREEMNGSPSRFGIFNGSNGAERHGLESYSGGGKGSDSVEAGSSLKRFEFSF